MPTTITVDDETHRVLIRALDLAQRVAMGQWREILDHCPEVTDCGQFSDAGDWLMNTRTLCATHDALVHPGASLSIRGAGRDAQIACDLWHALGGGMESRQNDRLTNASITVTKEPS